MESVLGPLLLQVVLIFFNAFFAAAEIAVISLNPARLKKMAEKEDKTAKRLLKMVEEPSGFLSSIQIGITLSGFLASAFAAESFSNIIVQWAVEDLGVRRIPENILDTAAVILITVVLSYFMLIFGELVPKRIAMQKSMEVAKFTSGVIAALSTLMRPVIWFLTKSTGIALHLLGLGDEEKEEGVTEEEIRLMVGVGEESGAIEPEEKEMIENIFEFNNKVAREIMTPCVDVRAIPIEMDTKEVISVIENSGFSRFPVYEGNIDHIKGILNARTFLLKSRGGEESGLAEQLHTPYYVPESIKIDDLFRNMQKNKISFAVVISEYGDTAGIVTMEDLLEEIVGDIYDEFDVPEEEEIKKTGDNLWRVSGELSIDVLSEILQIDFPEDIDFYTVGGLIFSRLDTIPPEGSAFDITVYGMDIHVEDIVNRRVKWAYIEKTEKRKASEASSS